METKFEYQVSPEVAEEIAIEQFDVLLRLRGVKFRYLPLGLGLLLALFLFLVPSVINLLRNPYPYRPVQFGGYAFTDDFILVPAGFVFGCGIGFLINKFVRWRILALARYAYGRMGPGRTVSWNPESITFQSSAYEVKFYWEMIDRIDIGYVGVYGVSGRTALFAIPKDAFPPNVTTAELIKAWRSGKRQPEKHIV